MEGMLPLQIEGLFRTLAFMMLLEPALAADATGGADRCDRLESMSCSPTTQDQYQDPTGDSRKVYDKERELESALDRNQGKIDKAARQMVERYRRPGGTMGARLKSLIDQMGRQNLPACPADSDDFSAACRAQVGGVLGSIMRARLRGQLAPGQVPLVRYPSGQPVGVDLLKELAEDNDFRAQTGQVADSIRQGYLTKSHEKTVATAFRRMKELLKEVVKSRASPGPGQEAMLRRLDEIQLNPSDCKKGRGGDEGDLSEFFTQNAYYNPGAKTVTVCRGWTLSASSLYSLYATLGHELGHGIDPCRGFNTEGRPMSEGGTFAMDAVLRCIQEKRSLGARVLPPQTGRPERCNNQYGESFADVISTEALALAHQKGYLGPKDAENSFRGFVNVWRANCRQIGGSSLGVHPPTHLRVSKVIAVHPWIRQVLGCPRADSNQDLYCGDNRKFAPGLELSDESQPPEGRR